MAQISKKLKYNEPAPKNIKNSGVVRVQNYNDVVEDISSIYNQLNNLSSNMELVDLAVGTGVTAGATTNEIISQSLYVPANTIPSTGLFDIMAKRMKSGSNFNVEFKLYTNTSASLVGASLIATFVTSSNFFGQVQRTFHVEGNKIYGIEQGLITNSDIMNSNFLPLGVTFDPTVDNYFLFTLKFGSAGVETAVVSFAKCVKYK